MTGLVRDILTEKYVIPKYQRGYRWGKDNVTELLQDIFENVLPLREDEITAINEAVVDNESYNICHNKYKDSTAYCIQPLVVVSSNGKYNIVDGQQRMTTIVIMIAALQYLGVKVTKCDIAYESRPDSSNFLSLIYTDVAKAEAEKDKNIDNAYMWQAFETARSFFEHATEKIQKNDDAETAQYRLQIYKALYNCLLTETRFIWYEPEGGNVDEQGVFAKFNTGKLELTNSELIKAEFMDPANYGGNISRASQIVISEKWDEIETRLHEDELWAFIPHRDQYKCGDYSTRIDAIFELYAVRCAKKVPSSAFGLYYTIKNDIIMERLSDAADKTEALKACWDDITLVFTELIGLYSDSATYNLVGLYIYLCNDSSETHTMVYKKLLDNVINVDRSERLDNLRRLIREKLFKDINKSNDISQFIESSLKKLKYSSAKKINNIMLAYNIALMCKTEQNKSKYSFLSHSNAKWEREHIFATNTDADHQEYIDIISDEAKRNAIELLRSDTDGGDNDFRKYVKFLYGEDIFSSGEECGMRDRAVRAEKIADELYDYYCQIDEIERLLEREDDYTCKLLLREFRAGFKVNQYGDIKMNIRDDENYSRWLRQLREGTITEVFSAEYGGWRYAPEDTGDNLEGNMHKSFNDHVRKLLERDTDVEVLRALLDLAVRTMRRLINDFFVKTSIKTSDEHGVSFNSLLHDNSLGNMTLLSEDLNKNISNQPYHQKQQMVYNAFTNNGFVPYGTLMVFAGKFTAGTIADNYWLPASRLKYLKSVIKEIKGLLITDSERGNNGANSDK